MADFRSSPRRTTSTSISSKGFVVILVDRGTSSFIPTSVAQPHRITPASLFFNVDDNLMHALMTKNAVRSGKLSYAYYTDIRVLTTGAVYAANDSRRRGGRCPRPRRMMPVTQSSVSVSSPSTRYLLELVQLS